MRGVGISRKGNEVITYSLRKGCLCKKAFVRNNELLMGRNNKDGGMFRLMNWKTCGVKNEETNVSKNISVVNLVLSFSSYSR